MSIWDEEDPNEEFRDVPMETAKDYVPQPPMPQPFRPAPTPQVNPNQNQFNGATGRFEEKTQEYSVDDNLDELLESVESEEDFEAVLNDANLRIEQGRLYQMLMNHALFEGMDADPQAIANVEREMRKFARDRMEIMLGMRQAAPTQNVQVASPFNDLEVDILKKLASKATNGATETPEANQVAAAVREAPRRQTLNPLGGSTGLKKAQVTQKQTQPTRTPPKSAIPLTQKPTTPVKRSKNEAIIDQILAEDPTISRADLELEYVGIGKQLHELTAEELAARQKQAAQRLAKHKTVKSSSALPMASPEQQEMLAMSRASQIGSAPGMAALLAKVKEMPIKNQ
jgi:hypothetical protein